MAPSLCAQGRACGRVLVDDLDQRDDVVARHLVGELRMVAAEVLERERDDFVLALAADDLRRIRI